MCRRSELGLLKNVIFKTDWMAKFYIIILCHVIFCRDVTICHDMSLISEMFISHCMKKVSLTSYASIR